MNRITLFLQDKDTINELIKDKDVQLRIKDAVLDQIARRAIKLSSLGEAVIQKARKEIEGMFLDGSVKGWCVSMDLKPEIKTLVRQQAKIAFEQLIQDELTL